MLLCFSTPDAVGEPSPPLSRHFCGRVQTSPSGPWRIPAHHGTDKMLPPRWASTRRRSTRWLWAGYCDLYRTLSTRRVGSGSTSGSHRSQQMRSRMADSVSIEDFRAERAHARAALRMIREALEQHCPSGTIPAEEFVEPWPLTLRPRSWSGRSTFWPASETEKKNPGCWKPSNRGGNSTRQFPETHEPTALITL